MLQAIIFDAEGALLNASEIHFQAFNRALATKGWMVTQSDHKELFDGMPTLKKLHYLTINRGLPVEWHRELLELKQTLTKEVINDFIQPDPEKVELVEYLKSCGIAVGVASNMQQQNLEALLRRIGVWSHLDAAIGHDRVGLDRVKPFPDVFLYTATALGTPISATAIVVDNSQALEAASASDPLDIVVVDNHESVNPELITRLFRFFPNELAA